MGTNARGDPFAPLEDQTLRRIAETGVVRAFPRNTVLINEGDVGDSLYVVLSGGPNAKVADTAPIETSAKPTEPAPPPPSADDEFARPKPRVQPPL